MPDELVDGVSDHGGVVALDEDLDVPVRREDGKVPLDDGPRVELGETLRIEAERSDRVRNRLEDLQEREQSARIRLVIVPRVQPYVDRRRDRVFDGVVQRLGDVRLLNRRQARWLVVDEGRDDVDGCGSAWPLASCPTALKTRPTESQKLGAKDDPVLDDRLDRAEKSCVDEVPETLGRARGLHEALERAEKTLE